MLLRVRQSKHARPLDDGLATIDESAGVATRFAPADAPCQELFRASPKFGRTRPVPTLFRLLLLLEVVPEPQAGDRHAPQELMLVDAPVPVDVVLQDERVAELRAKVVQGGKGDVGLEERWGVDSGKVLRSTWRSLASAGVQSRSERT